MTTVRFKKNEDIHGYTLRIINTQDTYTAVLDGGEALDLIKQMLPHLNRVELKPSQVLALWCEEHKQFHITTYNKLLSLVHKSYSGRDLTEVKK